MSLKLTLTPKKILMVIILVLGGFVFTQLAKKHIRQVPGGTSIVKIGDTITKVRFIGFVFILIFVIIVLSRVNKSNEKKHRSHK